MYLKVVSFSGTQRDYFNPYGSHLLCHSVHSIWYRYHERCRIAILTGPHSAIVSSSLVSPLSLILVRIRHHHRQNVEVAEVEVL